VSEVQLDSPINTNWVINVNETAKFPKRPARVAIWCTNDGALVSIGITDAQAGEKHGVAFPVWVPQSMAVPSIAHGLIVALQSVNPQ